MSITLLRDDEIVKQYEFENVLFYFVGDDEKLVNFDKSYSDTKYLYIMSSGDLKEISSLSILKKLELLSINACVPHMGGWLYRRQSD